MTTKDKDEKQEVTEGLSEWQKRNKEYLQKKAQEEAERQKELEEERKAHFPEEFEEDEEQTDEESRELADDSDKESDEQESAEAEDQEFDQEFSDEESPESDDLNLDEKKRKKLEKARLKAEKKAAKPKIERRYIYRALPVFFISAVLLLLAIYFLTPLATMKKLEVTGNQEVTRGAVLSSSLIDERDYTLTTWLNRAGYARNVKNSNPWIKNVSIDYKFPTNFTIKVTEYKVVAYENSSGNFYPVLASGQVIEQSVVESSLPERYMSLAFSDKAMIKKFVQELANVDDKTKSEIQKVSHTPSAATKDLLTLNMYNGNKILVPLSEISKKLPYYSRIQGQIVEGSTVDMEAGIFSYFGTETNSSSSSQNTAENNSENNE